ncbi:hypothetical protein [Nocardia jinanensis]|nr:hypothetical protein [Nocardia jinanensis]
MATLIAPVISAIEQPDADGPRGAIVPIAGAAAYRARFGVNR